jgi:serine-type D-Ala-D-Ala carboxypeptidase (penicillin-binding protein 5/6)
MKDSQPLKKKPRKFKRTKPPVAQKKEEEKQSITASAKVKSTDRIIQDKTFSFKKSFNGIRASYLSVIKTTGKIKTKVLRGKTSFIQILKKHDSDFALFLIPLILIVILAIINLSIYHIELDIQNNSLNTLRTTSKLNPYPLVNNEETPEITAKAAIILDSDSQVILYSKNPDLRFSMASTTKIMTAITALDYYDNNSLLTVKSAGVEGSTIGLLPGDTLSFEDILYAMLLPSANDAATTTANNYPGGIDAFVQKMNEKAAALYLTNTHFSDPTGLEDDGDYTTAIDMAHLASYAIKNEEFTKITSTKQKVITSIEYRKQYVLNNLNKLLGTDGVTGIKTGTTQGAGEVLVTATLENGHQFIIVVMNSTNRFSDTKILLDFIKKNVRYVYPSIPHMN